MKTVIGFYNSLIEEGIISIESRDGAFVAELPVRIGLMTGVARQDYYKRQDEIAATGFSSRALKVSWSYSDGTKKRIKDSASAREYLRDTTRYEISLPPPTPVNLFRKWASIIQEVAERVRDPADDLGVRAQKQLQRFLMGNALMNGRVTVDAEDIKKLRKYEKYFNDKCVAEV
jgi:histone H3/H4